MSRRVEVSIIVPTFDGAPYLRDCLDGIAAQDLRGVEVLVNDDGSNDETLEIARSYADRIPDLRVQQNPQRLGAVGNVNRCLHLARGRWIKPVFQDDMIEPGALSHLLAARRRGIPVVVGARTYRFEEGVPDWQREACQALVDAGLTTRFGAGPITAEQVAETAVRTVAERRPQLNFVGEPVAVLLHRRAALRAGGFDPGYAQLWDYELIVRLAMRRGLVLVDRPVATFRVHGGSETARNLAGSAFAANVVDRLRLLTSYAMEGAYRPVREAAARHVPPIDLTALAMGSSWAARRVAEDLPEGDRTAAEAVLAPLEAQLPTGLTPPWAGSYTATRYAVELLHELAGDVDAAVADLYATRPLAVDLAVPQDDPPAVHDGTSGSGAVSAGSGSPTSGPVPTDDPDPRPARRRRRTAPLRAVARAATALRSNQWWNHMLGPIVAFAYLQVGWRGTEPGEALLRVGALLWSAIALAAYGYLVNDAADVEADRRVGKPNAMANLTRPVQVAVIVAAAVLGALPWALVHLDAPALVALAAIYLVPLAYSPPPLRLKEHPLLGPLADASNAFVLPALFTVALFAPTGSAAGPPALMVAGAVAWALGFGLRAILLHQVDDASNDRASRTRTFVTVVGEAAAVRTMRRFLFPLELLGLALLATTVATWAWWLVAVLAVGLVAFHAARLRGVVDPSLSVTTVQRGWLLSWTQVWPALVLALGLTATDPAHLGLLGVVLVLFWPRLRTGGTHLRAVLANERLRRPRS